jgi:hypothetical protein
MIARREAVNQAVRVVHVDSEKQCMPTKMTMMTMVQPVRESNAILTKNAATRSYNLVNGIVIASFQFKIKEFIVKTNESFVFIFKASKRDRPPVFIYIIKFCCYTETHFFFFFISSISLLLDF